MQVKKAKTIVIDLRPLLGGNISGVENYCIYLTKNLIKIDKKNNYILWTNSHRKFTFPPELQGKNIQQIKTNYPNIFLNFALASGILRLEHILHSDFDEVFLPDPRPISTKKPIITTFHDLSFERFPHFFNTKTRIWHKILRPRALAHKSKQIICPSVSTGRDLIKIYQIPERKISVIYSAPIVKENNKITSKKTEEILDKFQIFDPYIFTLSTLEPRKNLEKLLLAFDIAKNFGKLPHKLVIAGKENRQIFQKMNLRSTKDIIFTGFIDEAEKEILYREADFFANVSLLEGFGLPVAESIYFGTPCLVSDNSSLMEVAGKSGYGVNPERVSSIAHGIKTLTKDSKLLQEMRKNCKAQSQKFSWEKCAKKTLRVLES